MESTARTATGMMGSRTTPSTPLPDSKATTQQSHVVSGTCYIGDSFETVLNPAVGWQDVKYVRAAGMRIAKIDSAGVHYLHKNHLGSTAIVTGDDGNVEESLHYMPYGSMREGIETGVTDFKFTDQELDRETNLYNYNARLYDPALGRFISPDPMIPDFYDPQQLNRYAYVRNNPLKYTDPDGHEIVDSNWEVHLPEPQPNMGFTPEVNEALFNSISPYGPGIYGGTANTALSAAQKGGIGIFGLTQSIGSFLIGYVAGVAFEAIMQCQKFSEKTKVERIKRIKSRMGKPRSAINDPLGIVGVGIDFGIDNSRDDNLSIKNKADDSLDKKKNATDNSNSNNHGKNEIDEEK